MNNVKPIKSQLDKEKMIDYLNTKHGKYVILFLIGVATGLRVSDILRLRVRDVLYAPFTVTEMKTKKTRQFDFSKAPYVGLLRALVDYVDRYNLQPGHYLIFSRPNEKHRSLSRIQAYRVLRAAGAFLGLQGIATHSMRKTFAREHFEAHKDIQALQSILNHKHTTTTLMYLFSMDELNGVRLK